MIQDEDFHGSCAMPAETPLSVALAAAQREVETIAASSLRDIRRNLEAIDREIAALAALGLSVSVNWPFGANAKAVHTRVAVSHTLKA